jgi:hypothetical protein
VRLYTFVVIPILSTNVDNIGQCYEKKLAGLVIPVLEPLGYQQGWGMATVARIRQEIPDDVGRLTLC